MAQIKRWVGLFALFLVSQFLILPASAATENNFPRVANYYLRWELSDSAATELAKWDLLILDMELQENSQAQLKKIRELNPKVIILVYITPQEIRQDAATSYSQLRRKLAQNIPEQWYLVDTSGKKITFWPGTYMLNPADNSPIYNGQRFNKFLARFVANEILSTGLWDGVFYDNAWEKLTWLTGKNVDLDRNGAIDSSIDQHWQDGYSFLYNETRRLAVGKGPAKVSDHYLIVGNGVTKAYADELDGIMIENFPSYGGTWNLAMDVYYFNEHNGRAPKVIVINSNTGNTGKSDNYKKVRYGLASALMGEAYFSFDHGDKDHSQTWWYDEYDVNLGAPASEARSAGGAEKFKEDVWRRDFQNGIALVNPTLESKTVDLGADYERIIGKQDKAVNDGSINSVVSLGAKDGLILLKSLQSEAFKDLVFSNGDFARFYDMKGNRARNGLFAYDESKPGGAKIFNGDLNGDRTLEKVVITGSKFEIFNSSGQRWYSYYPLGGNFSGEISLAVGNLLGLSQEQIMLSGASKGKTALTYDYHGAVINDIFSPLGKNYGKGFTLAIGNVDGGAGGEAIVCPGKGQSTEIMIYDSKLKKIKFRFYVNGKSFKDGARVATGDVNGDGLDEIIAAITLKNNSQVFVFNRNGKKLSQFSVGTGFGSQKIQVGALDVNFDGKDEIVVMNK